MAFQLNRIQSLNSAAKETKWYKNLKTPDIPKFNVPPKDTERHVAGDLNFIGAPRKATAPFVRVKPETSDEALYHLLINLWKLEEPHFLVSVTGGAKSFNVNHALLAKISNGLLKIAKTNGAWFITGGTNTGVMKLIGRILQGETKNCIGIASWGILQQIKDLEKAQDENCHTYDYKMNSSMSDEGSGQKAFLDHNHKQFILVDNGTEDFGAEIELRAKLESYITNKLKVPSVLLVIEGGANTILTVYNSMTQEPPMPVVVIKESGRASDCLAYAIEHIAEEEEKKLRTSSPEELKANGHFKFVKKKLDLPPAKHEQLVKAFNDLLLCLKYRHLITVFEIENDNDVDEAILQALLASTKESTREQTRQLLFSRLQLTILWNRADLAQENIFSKITLLKDEHYRDALIKAIELNRVEFVSIFVQFGVSLHNIITVGVLEDLYRSAAKSDSSPLNSKRILRALVGKDVSNENITRANVVEIVEKLCKNLILQKEKFLKTCANSNSKTLLAEPFKNLFVWALLNNFGEMALYFWQFDRDGMMKALVAASMLEEMSSHAKICGLKENVLITLDANAKLFREQAVLLLKECSERDEQMTAHLIDAPTTQFEFDPKSTFSRHTCLKIAFASNNRKFIAHETVQNLMTSQWYGTLVSLTTRDAFKAWVWPPYVARLNFKTRREINQMVDIAADYDKNGVHAKRRRFTAPTESKDQSFDENDGGKDDDNVFVTEKNALVMEDKKTYGTDENLQKNEIKSSGSNTFTNIENNDVPRVSGKSESVEEKVVEEELSYCEKYQHFIFTPYNIFFRYLITYLIFLFLLSYVAMLDKRNTKPGYIELFLLLFIISLTLEEFREFLLTDANNFKSKLKIYWSNNWNHLDCLAITLFYAAYVSHYYESANEYSHLLYALDAGLWVLRTLNFFYLHPVLGVYVIMIYKMFIDMIFFLMILLIFLIAYGVTSNAILSTKHNVGDMIVDVFWQPYFNIYGELFVDRDPENNSTTRFGTPVINQYGENVAWVILGIYLLIANVLLLNLLIAIFNNTFTEIQENAAEHWKFNRYPLIVELMLKSPTGHPLSLLYYLYVIIKWYFTKDDTEQQKKRKERKLELLRDILSQFEVDCMATLQKKQTSKAEECEIAEALLEKQTSNKQKINDLKDRMVTQEKKIDNVIDRLEQVLQELQQLKK